MDHNPYAPPRSAVAEAPESAIERPADHIHAMKFLWISFALGVISVVLILTSAMPTGVAVIFTFVFMAVLGVWAWVVVRIGRGWNWARIFYLILVILGALATVSQLRTNMSLYAASPMTAALAAAQAILQLGAAYLLFTARSHMWFMQQRARSADSR